jgi:carbon storage regulator
VLVLTRRQRETLRIDDDVTVTILGLKSNQVRLGIAAPRHIAVHREEVYKRIRRKGSVERHKELGVDESKTAADRGRSGDDYPLVK